MSAKMQFPLSQRRHTNIAVVRYTKNGIKLEIACYKNKVISYRSGIEDRLDEVLQVDRIFTNVGRGFVASKRDIQAVFSEDMSQDKCIKFILDHGELQVAHQERTAEIDELFKDIAVMISQKCVHKVNGRPFPTPVIEQSLRSIGATVKQDQPVKKQALSLIHQLIESQIIPITRAKMKVRCSSLTLDALHKLEEWCVENGAVVLEKSNITSSLSSQSVQSDALPPSSETEGAISLNQEPTGNNNHAPSNSMLILLPPHLLRLLDLCVKQQLPPGSTLDMVDPAVMDLSGVAEVSTVAEQLGNGISEEALPQGFAPHSSPSFSTSSSSSETSGGKGVFSGYSRAPNSSSSDDDDDDHDHDLKPTAHSLKNNNKKKELNKEIDDERIQRPRNAKPPRKELLSSALQLNLRDDSDKDSHSDDGKKVKKGKKKRKGGGAEKVAEGKLSNSSPPSAPTMEDDSDAEAEVNRRQRKKLNKKSEEAPQFQSYDEEFFDYEEEEEEETKTL